MEKVFYFDITHATKEHDNIIRMSGGKLGILNRNYLDSVLDHIKNDNYYPLFIDKLTHLIFSINKNHAFIDGNKRSSIALGAYFLAINGYNYCLYRFITEMENFSVLIAENKSSKGVLKQILISIINIEDYSEELKMIILKSIS